MLPLTCLFSFQLHVFFNTVSSHVAIGLASVIVWVVIKLHLCYNSDWFFFASGITLVETENHLPWHFFFLTYPGFWRCFRFWILSAKKCCFCGFYFTMCIFTDILLLVFIFQWYVWNPVTCNTFSLNFFLPLTFYYIKGNLANYNFTQFGRILHVLLKKKLSVFQSRF